MRKTPCEHIVWNILPCIRKKIAMSLLQRGLNQKEVAQKLDVSSAAISQYLSEKRGKMVKLSKDIEKEIEKSADKILKGTDTIEELCRICMIVKKEKNIDELIC